MRTEDQLDSRSNSPIFKHRSVPLKVSGWEVCPGDNNKEVSTLLSDTSVEEGWYAPERGLRTPKRLLVVRLGDVPVCKPIHYSEENPDLYSLWNVSEDIFCSRVGKCWNFSQFFLFSGENHPLSVLVTIVTRTENNERNWHFELSLHQK